MGKQRRCKFRREACERLHRPPDMAVTGVGDGHLEGTEVPLGDELDEPAFLYEFSDHHGWKIAYTHACQNCVYETGRIIDRQTRLYSQGDPVPIVCVQKGPFDRRLHA